MKKRATHLLFPLGVLGLVLCSNCAPIYPGGLSEAEFNSLSPEKRAQLQIEQQKADALRQANFESELDRAERQRQFDKKYEKKEPSIKLSKEETDLLNTLTE